MEDLALHLDYKELLEITSALIHACYGERIGHLSIKYDGCPAIVFGRTDDGDEFISTKSYFNKTPILYKSEEEIKTSGRDPVLIEKLLFYWQHLSWTFRGLENGRIFSADVLCDPWSRTPLGCRPNIIEYRPKEFAGLRGYWKYWEYMKLHLAIHTEIISGEEKPADSLSNSISGMSTEIYGLDSLKQSGIGNLLDDMTFLQFIPDLAKEKTHFDKCKKKINDVLRNADHHQSWWMDVPLTVEGIQTRNWSLLHDIKMQLLYHLDKHAHKPFDTFLDDKEIGGEGYVFRYKDYCIKLVDRYEFSKRNFDQSTPRGWKRTSK